MNQVIRNSWVARPLVIALLALACCVVATAADKEKTPEELAREAARELFKRGDALTRLRFTRTPEDVFHGAIDLAAGKDKDLEDGPRLQLYVKAGAWDRVRDEIKPYDPELARRLHIHILNDLVGAIPKPILLPLDVLGLADASPVEIDNRQTPQLGRLLVISLQGTTESRGELMALLRKGTARLGGTEAGPRRAAATMFASAELWAEAKEFGLADRELPASFAVTETVDKVVDQSWDIALEKVRNPPESEEERTKTLDNLYQWLVQTSPKVTEAKLGSLIDDRKETQLTGAVLALIGSKAARGLTEVDFHLRTANLELQRFAINRLSKVASLKEVPWQTVANLYARNWVTEVQFTLKTYPNWLKLTTPEYRDKYQHVAIEDVLANAPAGVWLDALLPQISSMAKTLTARTILASDKIDRMLPLLRTFVKDDPKLAAEFANAYLILWAQRHNPNLTPEALKQYKLDNQAIVLTRQEQEASLKQLGELLDALDPATRQLLDEERAVLAFDLCHSKAEIYTQAHVTQVFGSLDKLRPSLMLILFERMRTKLASNWRELSVQRDAATKRGAAEVFELVNDGYEEADHISAAWLKTHPEDWRMCCSAGSMVSDWSEFAYFEAVAGDGNTDRFALYLKRAALAMERFRAGAKAYAENLSKMKRSEQALLPYKAWFYGLLGMSHDSDVNLRKGVTREGLQEIRQAMLDLPGGAGEAHLEMFSAMVAENVQKARIAPEMKFRYLSSAVQVTGRRPTVYPAEEKVQYYNSLLQEVRLETRLDGDDQIRPGADFGVFVSLVHTADLARESGGFSKYLMNKVRRMISGKNVTEEPFYRDRFEEAMRLALGDFFEIRAIVFADPNGEARAYETRAAKDKDDDENSGPADERDWQETPLAYLHLAAKDATVDRVPPLEIELDFFDRDGKVIIPVPSNPLQIEITADAPAARPTSDLEVTEIVDSRELADRRLKMDVIATAHGLLPELDELVDLAGYKLKPLAVNARAGLLVRELHNGADGLYAVSERSWTIDLDPTLLLRGASERIDFDFPAVKSQDIKVNYRRYEDADPVAVAEKVTLAEGTAVEEVSETNYYVWTFGSLAALVVLAMLVMTFRKPADTSAAGPPPFEMPREVTPFSIATLLHRIQSSRNTPLSVDEQSQLRHDIATLERSAFAPQANGHTSDDLTALARRWLDTALLRSAGTSAN